MDTKIMTNPSELNESDKTYRALENSILKIQRSINKLAKKSNPSHELQAFWELGDLSLINWISDTNCYISRRGQKLQYLAKPSKLEIITFHLEEGDKILICGESLMNKISEDEIDEILHNSTGVKDSCLNLLKIANIDTPYSVYNVHNVIVLEVIDQKKVVTPVISNDNNPFITKSNDKYLFIPIVLVIFSLLAYSYGRKNTFDISMLFNRQENKVVVEDTVDITPKDSLQPIQNNQVIVDDFEDNKLTETAKNSTNNFEESNPKQSTNKLETSKSDFSTFDEPKSTGPTEGSKSKAKPFSYSKEQQNYTALLEQKDKWTAIRKDLQDKYNSGDLSVSDQLENSKKVLDRIGQKIKESAKKLNQD
ncbi:hypothetical protein J2Y60_002907 [Arcicella sp. BE140]|uniref:hypothetical protein n=2 Tax=Arcicella TaxID=217140 RepID=UPI00285EEDA4|nr:hypothetical protein [Arcicella sp. BE140]MDR6812701.1 hypothetical protein [Arcicella sp. BE140]